MTPSLPGAGTLLSVLLCLGLACNPADPRRNILFIIADDLNTCLRCYGNPVVQSPNIDRLAARGVRFDRAYAQAPLCNPSRASLMTGLYPPTLGVENNWTSFRERMPDAVTLPHYFRNHGYLTARAGKILHGASYDEPAWVEGGEAPRTGRPTAAERKAYQARSDRWEALEGDGQDEPDHQVASRAIELLRRHRDQPFFLAVGFQRPHTPLIAPRRYFELYPPETIELPPSFAPRVKPPRGVPPGALGRNWDLFVGREASPREAREAIAAYYAAVSFVDAQVGRILAALEELQLQDDTIVVFLSDHGFHLGDRGKWSKHSSFFEPALRVPLIVAAPGEGARGVVSGRTVELLDLYPTLVELAGLPKPNDLEGQSFAPLLIDPDAPWEHPAYSFGRSSLGFAASIRTERYRYTEWEGQARRRGHMPAVFTDYASDPHERRNLLRDPAYADRVQRLRPQLRAAKNRLLGRGGR